MITQNEWEESGKLILHRLFRIPSITLTKTGNSEEFPLLARGKIAYTKGLRTFFNLIFEMEIVAILSLPKFSKIFDWWIESIWKVTSFYVFTDFNSISVFSHLTPLAPSREISRRDHWGLWWKLPTSWDLKASILDPLWLLIIPY